MAKLKVFNPQNKIQGSSLVVQWLRLYAFTAKGMGSILGQGTKAPQAACCGEEI